MIGPESESKLAEIHAKLDRLDEAIRGNGKLGILTRLDRLEQIEAHRSKAKWLLVSALFTLGAGLLLQLIQFIASVGR